jgi:hypothetical protein
MRGDAVATVRARDLVGRPDDLDHSYGFAALSMYHVQISLSDLFFEQWSHPNRLGNVRYSFIDKSRSPFGISREGPGARIDRGSARVILVR